MEAPTLASLAAETLGLRILAICEAAIAKCFDNSVGMAFSIDTIRCGQRSEDRIADALRFIDMPFCAVNR